MAILENPSFADYFDSWYETYKKDSVSDNTRRHYVLVGKLVRNFFKNEKLRKVKRQCYQQFINEFGANHAPESVRKVRNLTRACVKSAILDGIITKDFTQNVEFVADEDRAMKVEYLSLSELQQLKKALLENRTPLYTSPWRPFIPVPV